MKRFMSGIRWAGKWGLRGALVVVLLAVVAVVIINWRGSRAREAALQAMADAGIDLPAESSMGGEGDTYNGGALVRAAMEALRFPDAWGEDAPVFSTEEAMQTQFGEPIDPMIAERVVRFRDRVSPVLELVQRAAAAEQFTYDPWPYLRGERMGDYAGLRQIARVLQSAALADEAEGDVDGAFERYRQLAIVNASTSAIPTVIWQFVRTSVDALIHGATEETLSRGEASPSTVSALRNALLVAEARSQPTKMLAAAAIEHASLLKNVEETAARQHVEMTRWLDVAARNPHGGWPGGWQVPGPVERAWMSAKDRLRLVSAWFCPGWLELQWAGSLQEVLAWRDVLVLPPAERARRIAEAVAAQDDDTFALTLRTALLQQAILRVTATALAVEQYRLEHGDWPASAAALGDAWMNDPFDGQPLRYRRTQEGVVIYSIGRDLEDDGGLDDDREGDLDFRLLDVPRG